MHPISIIISLEGVVKLCRFIALKFIFICGCIWRYLNILQSGQ